MKTKLIAILIAVFSCIVLPAMAQEGFTNKAEAANQLVSGLKEGKWIVYLDSSWLVTADTNRAPYYRLVVYNAGNPVGIVRDFYKSGKLQELYFYTNGKENGEAKWYHEDGTLDQVGTYIDGKRNGTFTIYYESGKLKSEIPYSDDNRNGLAKWYFESGVLQTEAPYINNQKNGIFKEYYDDGKLKQETPYTDDKINGVLKGYYADGTLMEEAPYINDKKNGLFKWYYANRKLKGETPYIDDKRNGSAKEYYENGALHTKQPFTNDMGNGMEKWYYEDGALQQEQPVTDDKVNGIVKFYSESGVLTQEQPVINDKVNGIVKFYNENGVLDQETPYTDGVAGTTVFYNTQNVKLTLNDNFYSAFSVGVILPQGSFAQQIPVTITYFSDLTLPFKGQEGLGATTGFNFNYALFASLSNLRLGPALPARIGLQFGIDFGYIPTNWSNVNWSNYNMTLSTSPFLYTGFKIGPEFNINPIRNMGIGIYVTADPDLTFPGGETSTYKGSTGTYSYTGTYDVSDSSTVGLNINVSAGLNFYYKALILGVEYNWVHTEYNGSVKQNETDTYPNGSLSYPKASYSFGDVIHTNMLKLTIGFRFG
jgi:antitoxin component YwqK of YwqJK toxin-antitoxin module